jgi:hypothetical protein
VSRWEAGFGGGVLDVWMCFQTPGWVVTCGNLGVKCEAVHQWRVAPSGFPKERPGGPFFRSIRVNTVTCVAIIEGVGVPHGVWVCRLCVSDTPTLPQLFGLLRKLRSVHVCGVVRAVVVGLHRTGYGFGWDVGPLLNERYFESGDRRLGRW